MSGSTKLLVVLAVIAGIVCALPCAAVTWDFKTDIAAAMNPSGMLIHPRDWTYGYAANANPFIGYQFKQFYGAGVDRSSVFYSNPPPLSFNKVWVFWQPSTAAQSEVPCIYYNNTASANSSANATTITIASKDTAVYAGPYTTNTKTIVRWTAPGPGTYNVSATFTRYTADWRGPNTYDNDVHVIKNATVALLSTSVGGVGSDVASYSDSALSLNAGDTIDFVVGRGVHSDTGHRACNLSATIISATPEATVSGITTPGAKVTAAGGKRSVIADESGNFSLEVLQGANSFTVTKPGYVPQTFAVTAPSSGNDLTLTTASGTVIGRVTADGKNVYRAKVEVVGGTDFTYTAADGTYTLYLPTGSYNLKASKLRGFTSQTVNNVSVTNGSTTTQDFTISMDPGANWPAAVANETCNMQNPNDNWSYGWAPDATPFTGYTFTLLTEMHIGRGNWWSNGASAVYATGGPDSWANEGWYAGPYIGQRADTTVKTIIRFTAPVPGWYTIDSNWGQMWNGHVDWHVVVNDVKGERVLQSGSGAPGSGEPLYTGVNLPEGGTIDFCIGDGDNGISGDAARLNAVVSYGVSGITGWVRDSGGNPIVGARIQVGDDWTLTDASGDYALPTSTGSVTFVVTKPGYESYTDTVTVNTAQLTTANVTMATSGVFSGRVLARPAPGTAIEGAKVESMDGEYSFTSGSDGSFSGIVTSGTRRFRVHKLGYVANIVTVTIPPTGLNQDIMMTQGWDLAAEFKAGVHDQPGSTVNGPWAFAFDNGTAVSTTMAYYHPASPGAPWAQAWLGAKSTLGGYGAWIRNASYVVRPKTDNIRAVVEQWALVTHPGYQNNNGRAGTKTIARFTAPESGYFDIDVRLTGRTDSELPLGTTSEVSLVKTDAGGTSSLMSGKMDGYVGTPSHNYTDSFGSAPVITYSQAQAVEAGDIYELIFSGDNSGWTGVEFTVSTRSASIITGQVTSDKPGNPAVVNALITASAPGMDSFTTITDGEGRYLLTLPAGTYDVVATRAGYTDPNGTGNATGVVTVGGESTVQDFQLVFGGVWDAAVDFSSVTNPNGDWSYGWSTKSSNRAEFTLYTQVHGVVGGEYANYKFWTAFDGAMWWGGIRKNDDSVLSIFDTPWPGAEYQQTWYAEPNQLLMTPGGMNWFSVLRWTAPKQMVVNVDATWKSQWAPGYITNGEGGQKVPMEIALVKNGTVISAPILAGFIGRAVNDFTDSSGNSTYPSYGPSVTFSSPILVNAGDTIDFSYMPRLHQQYLIGIGARISEFNGQYAIVNSISEIKAQEDGTVVFLETPMQLACGTYHTGAGQKGSFHFQYGTGLSEVSWFIQTDDRTQGIKCIVPSGGLPNLDVNNKVTLTGVVDTDEFGEKVILVGAINSYTASEEPMPLGKTTKALTSSGTLVRVWGRITELVENPNPVINPENDTKDFVYEYMTLNDGGKSVKVLMHVQGEMISDYDQWVRDLSIGDYLGVTGIAYTIGNGEVVVMPRYAGDFTVYSNTTP